MNSDYRVDDILQEIKKKKAAAQGHRNAPPASSAADLWARTTTAASQPPPEPGPVPAPEQKPAAQVQEPAERERDWEDLWSAAAGRQNPAPKEPPPLREYAVKQAPPIAAAVAPQEKEREEEIPEFHPHNQVLPPQPAREPEIQATQAPPVRREPPRRAEEPPTQEEKPSFQVHIPGFDEDPPPAPDTAGLAQRRRQKVDAFFSQKPAFVPEEPQEGPSEPTRVTELPPIEDEEEEEPPRRRGFFRFGRKPEQDEEEEDETEEAEDGQDEDEDEEAEEPLSPGFFTRDLTHTSVTLLVKTGVSLLGFILLLYLHFSKVGLTALFDPENAKNSLLWIPEFMYPESKPLVFLAVNLAIFLVMTVVCSSTIGGGLIALFTMRADNDSLAAVSVVAGITQCVVLLFMPDSLMLESVHLYLFIPALALTLNHIGKLLYTRRVGLSYKTMNPPADNETYRRGAILCVEKPEFTRELTKGLDLDDPVVAYSVPAKEFTGFQDAVYTADYSENLARIISPLCFLASAGVSIASYFFSKDAFGALTAFAALTAVCAPFTMVLAATIPLCRMAKVLQKQGAVISGYEAVEALADVNSVILDATDLFSGADVTMFHIKTFAEKRIDDALLDAASLICVSGSTLTGIFNNIIQGQAKLLRPVENIAYEDGMGLSAWVNKRRVLIGNRRLMQNYGIDTPSKDYEMKFARDNRDILYLASSGELAAMFVLGYSANEEAKEMLDMLDEKGISILVNANDPNITPEMISRIYDFPLENIRVVPAKLKNEVTRLKRPRETAPGNACCTASAMSFIRAVVAADSARTVVMTAAVIQGIGIGLGYAIVAFFAFCSKISLITPDILFVFLLIWAAVVLAVPRFKKI